MNFYQISLAVILASYSMFCFSLKVDSHVWVGQQVINDLAADGKLDIEINGSVVAIAPPADVVQAILANRNAYLMGHVGPDAIPDPIVGQTLLHPGNGNTKYWQANDWMEYLLERTSSSAIGKSYAYGVLGHASADVFTHTYVNQYAGDKFELFDEVVVERRHVALEAYISNFLPPISGNDGRNLSAIMGGLGLDEQLARELSALYFRDEQIQNQFAAGQYSGYLASMGRYRKEINRLAEDPIWHEIDIVAAQLAAQYWLDIELTSSEASKIVNAAQPVINTLNIDTVDFVQSVDDQLHDYAKKYEAMGYSTALNHWNQYHDAVAGILNIQNDIEQKVNNIAGEIAATSCELIHEVALAPFGIHEYLFDQLPLTKGQQAIVSALVDPLGVLNSEVGRKIVDPFGVFGSKKKVPSKPKVIVVTDTVAGFKIRLASLLEGKGVWLEARNNANQWGDEREYNIADSNLAGINRQIELISNSIVGLADDQLVSTYSTENGFSGVNSGSDFILCKLTDFIHNKVAVRLLNEKRNLELDLVEAKRSAADPAIRLRDALVNAAADAQVIKQSMIDLAQAFSGDVSPIQSYLRAWRTDVDTAYTAYLTAAARFTVLSASGQGGEAIKPIQDWFDCHLVSLAGINSAVSGCEFRNALADLERIALSLDKIAVSALAPDELRFYALEIAQLHQALKESLRAEFREYIKGEVVDVIPPEVKEIVAVISSPIDDAKLNFEFSQTTSIKPLIKIPDMASRVKSEMKLVNGFLNPKEYSVIRNAIQLSKIALLDSAGVQLLYAAAGSNPSPAQQSNIVASAFANLDGNHQWMKTPLKLPATTSPFYFYYDNGYPVTQAPRGYSSPSGFLLWQSTNDRKVFRSLFSGPLAPGIEEPRMLGFNELLPPDFPDYTCFAVPFAASDEDRTCTIVKILPALLLINN